MIVIDLGCAPWGEEVSIEKLVRRFEPATLFGFDPALIHPSQYAIGATSCVLSPKAAWTYDGWIGYEPAAQRSALVQTGGTPVECFDFAEFLVAMGSELEDDLVVKMDIEGAEYELLDYLHEGGQDAGIDLLLVEWHCLSCGRGGDNADGRCPNCRKKVRRITDLRCETEDWNG